MIHFGLEVSEQFGPKKAEYPQRPLDLYQFFMHNILYQDVSRFFFYILAKLLITWLTQFWVITFNFLIMNLTIKSWKPCLLYYWHTLKILFLLPNLIWIFINKKWFLFSHPLTGNNPNIFLDAILQELILCFTLF